MDSLATTISIDPAKPDKLEILDEVKVDENVLAGLCYSRNGPRGTL